MPPQDSLIKLVLDLIRFESTKNKPGQIQKCMEYAGNFFAKTDLDVKHHEINGVHNLVITKKTKSPKIFLCGHLDVVEANAQQFRPQIKNGRIYGRGALDMKGGIACLMQTMKDAVDADHDVGLMLTGDEEQGGANGTGALLEMGYACKAAVLPDGGTAVHRIIYKSKGAIWLELTAVGKSAHASRPWEGKNAINKLTTAIDLLKNIFTPIEKHPENHWTATCNIGVIQGGDTANKVPGRARAVCDIRHTEDQTAGQIMKIVKEILPDGVQAKQLVTIDAMYADPQDPFLLAYQEAIRRIGREPELCADHGASDGRYFSNRGIPVLISVPDGRGTHAEDEWVSIQGLKDYTAMLGNFLDLTAKYE